MAKLFTILLLLYAMALFKQLESVPLYKSGSLSDAGRVMINKRQAPNAPMPGNTVPDAQDEDDGPAEGGGMKPTIPKAETQPATNRASTSTSPPTTSIPTKPAPIAMKDLLPKSASPTEITSSTPLPVKNGLVLGLFGPSVAVFDIPYKAAVHSLNTREIARLLPLQLEAAIAEEEAKEKKRRS